MAPPKIRHPCASRGQLFTADFVMAVFVFASAMLLGLSIAGQIGSAQSSLHDTEFRSQKQLQALSELVTHGLANDPYVLSRERLSAFSAAYAADANGFRSRLGFSGPARVSIIQNRTGEVLYSAGDFLPPAGNRYRFTAYAVLDQNIVNVVLEGFS